MLPIQLTTQAPQHLSLVGRSYPGHHLGGEHLALHTGHSQRGPQRLSQTADALHNHRLHPCRQRLPVQRRPFNPPAFRVLDQIPRFCMPRSSSMAPPQFSREQGGGRASQCDFFRAVGLHDQDPAARQLPAQVEEQADHRRCRRASFQTGCLSCQTATRSRSWTSYAYPVRIDNTRSPIIRSGMRKPLFCRNSLKKYRYYSGSS
jgi:hypothetical protein